MRRQPAEVRVRVCVVPVREQVGRRGSGRGGGGSALVWRQCEVCIRNHVVVHEVLMLLCKGMSLRNLS